MNIRDLWLFGGDKSKLHQLQPEEKNLEHIPNLKESEMGGG